MGGGCYCSIHLSPATHICHPHFPCLPHHRPWHVAPVPLGCAHHGFCGLIWELLVHHCQQSTALYTNHSMVLGRGTVEPVPAVNPACSHHPAAPCTLRLPKTCNCLLLPGQSPALLASAHSMRHQTYPATVTSYCSLPASLHSHATSHTPTEQQPAHVSARATLADAVPLYGKHLQSTHGPQLQLHLIQPSSAHPMPLSPLPLPGWVTTMLAPACAQGTGDSSHHRQ